MESVYFPVVIAISTLIFVFGQPYLLSLINSLKRVMAGKAHQKTDRPESHVECSQIQSTVQQLIDRARFKISAGDGQEALASLIQAITLSQGESAVGQVLSDARARAQGDRMSESSTFASDHEPFLSDLDLALIAIEKLADNPSLLLDRGDGSEQILRDAFEDGSSVVCKNCGGLIKIERWDAHCATWCPALESADD